jgi:hypothetical protein
MQEQQVKQTTSAMAESAEAAGLSVKAAGWMGFISPPR